MKKARTIISQAIATMMLIAIPLTAWSAPQISLSIKAEKEIIVEEEGEKVKKIVEAKEVAPGETVIYTISFKNSGDEAATDVIIIDPIPEGTAYVAGSATALGEVTFSIDGGNTFQLPTLLTYEVILADGSKQKRIASPDQYTQIRWTLPAVAAGESGSVAFQVQPK